MKKNRKWRASSVAEWESRLARWRVSRDTVAAFCRKERVSVPSFYLWRRRLQSEELDAARRSARRPSFLPVEVLAEPRTAPSCHHLCDLVVGALVCRVPQGVDDATLRRLVRVLREEGVSC
ncbi:MAG: hypothetical protein KDA60_16330 [Planctomycetales bacterium]|nr:hypothetical protein [Planctomycetales bacterium]